MAERPKIEGANTVGILLGPDDINAFSFKNAYSLMRFRLPYTLQRPKTLMKTKAFENGFESGVF